MNGPLSITALAGLGEITPGTSLGALIAASVQQLGLNLQRHDVLVIAQKAVSKAEDRFIDLRTITPSGRAEELARICCKDARLVEVILAESTEVLRVKPNVLIVRHRLGYVMAQGGVDRSNVASSPDEERVLLLPVDPDVSATRVRSEIKNLLGVAPGVVISDSFGRPWRLGVVNVAIGAAGVPALWDRRGEADREGRILEVTEVAWADAVAAAAGLVMGEAAEGTPVVIVHGLEWRAPERPATAMLRPPAQDLFT